MLSLIAKPWLLVFDNADDNHRLVTDHWVHSKVGAILVTSRSTIYKTKIVCGSGTLLPALSERLAVSMLFAQVSQSTIGNDNYEQALKIVKRVDCVPIGIQASISLLHETEDSCFGSLEDFNEQWPKPRHVLEEANVDRLHRHYAPYTTCLFEAYSSLVAGLESPSRLLVNILSLLDPDKLQVKELLNKVRLVNTPSAVALKTVTGNRAKYLGPLTLKSLICGHATQDKSPESFNMHRLLKAFLQGEMQNDLTLARSAISGASVLISSALTHVWESNGSKMRTEFAEFFPHVQSIHEFYVECVEGGQDSFKLPIEFIQLSHIAASYVALPIVITCTYM